MDISYCVGTTGISPPFACASRCAEFPGFELVQTWSTGALMSDSCGYIALDHGWAAAGDSTAGTGTGAGGEVGGGSGRGGRVIVAFRGTYSIANTIVDLSTVPQEYVPYPGEPEDEQPGRTSGRRRHRFLDWIPRPWTVADEGKEEEEVRKCLNCTVHTGFWTSWQNTRSFVVPHIKHLKEKYPEYRLELVGHSLGGAVAVLAGLEFDALGYQPRITTFGEPRVGNKGLRDFIDGVFELPSEHLEAGKGERELFSGRYRRVTHVDDPVPLLPLQEWGYRPHAGEVYISKAALQPGLDDVSLCFGDEDTECIAGAEVDEDWFEDNADMNADQELLMETSEEEVVMLQKRWGIPIPARYKMWQLFFAHRDYFWRLGLCVPGGDPFDWGRERYDLGDGDEDKERTDL